MILVINPYFIFACIIIVALIVIFFLTYVINKRTPIPEGCSEVVNSINCAGCSNKNCEHYLDLDKIQDDIINDKAEMKK